jgi:hypothetical protein
MRARLLALAERRARLIERAAAEREALGAWIGRADAVAGAVSECSALAQRLYREALARPLWIAAAVALAFALRPKRTVKLLMSGWSLWRLYRRARRWWDALAPGHGT